MWLKPKQKNLLNRLSIKYIWWKSVEESMLMPDRVIAQVMNIGDYTDVQELADKIGDTALQDVLMNAQAGQFNERSWAYWHYRLGLSHLDEIPPLPERIFP